MLIAYLLVILIGLVMIAKPAFALHIIKGPTIPEKSEIEAIWLYKIRYIGWFVIVIGGIGIYTIVT